jgi:uncharacterized protein
MEGAARARRGVALFLVVLAAEVVAFTLYVCRSGAAIDRSPAVIATLMWTPALASLVARLVLREPIRDVSFRWGGRAGTWAVFEALAFPLVVGAIAYGIAWASGLAAWSPPRLDRIGPHVEGRFARFLVLTVTNLLIGPVIGSLFAAGEEIGWRGYLLTRLIAGRLPRPVLLSGIIWWLFHVPLIVLGWYPVGPAPRLGVFVFGATVIAFAYFLAALRLRSGSIWPPVVAHATWNAIIQDVFEVSTPTRTIWTGEAGLLVAITTAVLVVCIASVSSGRTVSETVG